MYGNSRVWLISLRCSSSYPGYAQYYDERLALLTIGDAAMLGLIPLAEDCSNCSELSHIISTERSFRLGEESNLFELSSASSSDNPCCDGPSRWKEKRLFYFLLPEAVPIFSLTRSRERYDHDDVEGDREELCRAEISYDLDEDDDLRGITSRMTCRIDGDAAVTQTQHYRWLPEARRFE